MIPANDHSTPIPLTFAVASIRAELNDLTRCCPYVRVSAPEVQARLARVQWLLDEIEAAAGTVRLPVHVTEGEKSNGRLPNDV